LNWSGEVAIVGAYESPRRAAEGVHPFEVQQECIAGALDDAGLEIGDVDGFCTAAGDLGEGGAVADVIEVAEYLGIQPTYVDSTDVGGCSYIVHAGHAAAAIATGMADVVVISYAACPRWWPIPGMWDAMVHPTGPGQFEMPYAPTLIAGYALVAQRHMHEFGTTPEQLAEVAVACRAHAAGNEHARYREPLTVSDVLESRMIASPLRVRDCCVVTDSGGAVVLASQRRARDCRKPPVCITGFGEAISRVLFNQMNPMTQTPATISGRRAFDMAGVRRDDVDVAQLYDAFTITPILALEDLGFCAKGDGGPFVATGAIREGGELPINTDGGGLASNHPGRRGIFALIEGVRQLRGEGPGVSVPDCRVSLVHGLGGVFSAAATMILEV
jgi:acetyl-CoA acetyltransferase